MQKERGFSIFLIFKFPVYIYATKNKKIMRNAISTKNIFIISQRFDDILFRYLTSWLCAPSTFASDSSMFSSILSVQKEFITNLKDLLSKTVTNVNKSISAVPNYLLAI